MIQERTDRRYQIQLNMIHDRVLSMAKKVQTMANIAIKAYVEKNRELVRKIEVLEDEVNTLEIEIDNLCVTVLTKSQSVASDLRFIIAVLKLNPNLERIGDHAVSICNRAEEMINRKLTLPSGIDSMKELFLSMLSDAVTAFIKRDSTLAEDVIKRDALLDTYYVEMMRETFKLIEKNSADTFAAMNIQSVAKNIERMGDHVKNLAEFVIYLAGGRDVRHLESLKSTKASIKAILLLCIHNSGRGQMAEGFAKHIFPKGVAIYSAGPDPSPEINPLAVKTMAEIGIDISKQKPKKISDVPLDKIDVVITLCSEEVCMDLPGKKSETWNLPNPSQFTGNEEEIYMKIVALRDEIKLRIETINKDLFSSN